MGGERLLGKGLFVLGGLLLAAVDGARAQTARPDTSSIAPIKQTGSWSAATANGLTLMGAWTAILDPSGTVTGTWALLDAQGNTRAEGGWSAAKSPDGWAGAWRASVAGKEGEYSGSWTAALDAKSGTRLTDMFEKAAQAIVSGDWRVAGRSGAWSIRTFK
jgi:hypothetical protein